MRFLKDYIKFTNKYIKDNLITHIIINSIVFVVIGFAAFFAIKVLPTDAVNEIYANIYEMFDSKNLVNPDGTLSFFGILFNNLRAGLVISLFGFVPLLFLPLLFVVLNSGIVGAFMGIVDVMTTQNVLIMFVKYILPHGIFEIPALVIEGAIGTKICAFLCRKIFRKANGEKLLLHIKGCFGIFAFYVIPMLIIAAFIEAVVLEILFL